MHGIWHGHLTSRSGSRNGLENTYGSLVTHSFIYCNTYIKIHKNRDILIKLYVLMRYHRSLPSHQRQTVLWNSNKPRECQWSHHQHSHRIYSEKMHVPSDSFGGRSPEKQGSFVLETLFTFVACKIVLAQMQGDGRGELGSYGGDKYTTLVDFMDTNPLHGRTNVSEWLSNLLKVDSQLALRIIEVRYSYARDDFEWDQLKMLAVKSLKKENIEVLRDYMEGRVYSNEDEP